MSFATFGAVVPPALLSPTLCAVLELARLGCWLQPPAELEGRSVALTLTDLGLRHGLCCRDGRLRPHGVADAELSLSASLAAISSSTMRICPKLIGATSDEKELSVTGPSKLRYC